ncbi:hypothetical protein BD410DRAFT_788100 [Rickenella mellea]|uniref:Uncharacterized protein n=1 Tax=Rickenella mellea TaxID=50990 RepID=A0A4Y7Q6D4_9AGAM|nr:hypothetical protein BD410DRAFT_788100 [Rickenella mellea]
MYGGNLEENSGDVDIPINEYTAIINEPALFVPTIAYQSNWGPPDFSDFSVEFLDASAKAIRKILHCRVHATWPWSENLPIILDAQHISAVRKLRYSFVWGNSLTRRQRISGIFSTWTTVTMCVYLRVGSYHPVIDLYAVVCRLMYTRNYSSMTRIFFYMVCFNCVF